MLFQTTFKKNNLDPQCQTQRNTSLHWLKKFLAISPTFVVACASIVITAFFVWSSTAASRAWSEAKQLNTVAAYKEFISLWPSELQVQYAKAALGKLELEDFNQAIDANNNSAYESYLQAWPNGTYIKIIERRIAELSNQDNSESYD